MCIVVTLIETARKEQRNLEASERRLFGIQSADIATTPPRETFTCVCSKCAEKVCTSDYMVSLLALTLKALNLILSTFRDLHL